MFHPPCPSFSDPLGVLLDPAYDMLLLLARHLTGVVLDARELLENSGSIHVA